MAIVQSYPPGSVIVFPDDNGTQELPDGSILRVVHIDFMVERFRGAPDAHEELEIDYTTNKALIDDIADNPAPYRLIDGVLTKDGQTVTPQTDGPLQRAIKALNVIEEKADGGTFANNGERDRAIGMLARILKVVVKNVPRGD